MVLRYNCTAKMMKAEQTWYNTLFNEDYLAIYEHIWTPERADHEVDLISDLLQLPEGSRILDLGCGVGRHAIRLARRGYAVTGLDLSPLFLKIAQAEANRMGVSVEWVESDMRQIPFENEFDAVINMFTSFGYFESDEEDLKALQAVYRALKPKGIVLMQYVNRESVLRRFQPDVEIDGHNGYWCQEHRSFDLWTGRLNSELTITNPQGDSSDYTYSNRFYTLTELITQFDKAGFRVDSCYGGLDGRPLTLDSVALVLIAIKQ